MPRTDSAKSLFHLMIDGKPEEQETLIRDLADFIETRMRPHKGFVSARLYATDDGKQVIEQFEWTDHASYMAYRRSEDGETGFEWLRKQKPSIQHMTLAHTIDAE